MPKAAFARQQLGNILQTDQLFNQLFRIGKLVSDV